MEKAKLYKKCFNRIGMTAIEKATMRKGVINTFSVNEKPDGSFEVTYLISFDAGEFIRVEPVHESDLVIMLGTGL